MHMILQNAHKPRLKSILKDKEPRLLRVMESELVDHRHSTSSTVPLDTDLNLILSVVSPCLV